LKNTANELLNGAIDIHFHGYPEISFDVTCSAEDIENFELAQKAGFKAIVLKSHFWPTVGRVYDMNKNLSGIDIFGSITLNTSAGGVHGYAAEAAVKQGAKVIWLPTWSAKNDIERQGFSAFVKKHINYLQSFGVEDGLSICDSGHLSQGMHEVLEVALEYNIAIFTGHLSPAESLALARESREKKFEKLVFGHPMIGLVGASLEEMQEFVRLGGLVEFTFLPTLPHLQKLSINNIADAILKLGAQNCIISSDHFNVWSPPACEMIRMFVVGLLERNISEDSIKLMLHENPARLLYD
jgi:hypothetical protein